LEINAKNDGATCICHHLYFMFSKRVGTQKIVYIQQHSVIKEKQACDPPIINKSHKLNIGENKIGENTKSYNGKRDMRGWNGEDHQEHVKGQDG
jgi:hypothetical protein